MCLIPIPTTKNISIKPSIKIVIIDLALYLIVFQGK